MTGWQLSRVKANNTTMYFDITNQVDGTHLVKVLNTDGSILMEKKIVKVQ